MSAPGPHHERARAGYLARGDWIEGPTPDPLSDFARVMPDKIAVIDGHGALDYATLDGLVRRFACALITRGIGRGDRVAIQLPNQRAFVIAQQAAIRLGAAYVPLLPQLGEADLHFALEAAQARALILPLEYRGQKLREMAARLPVTEVFHVGGGSFDEALEQPVEERHGAALDAIHIDPDALRVVLFTSGTESRPKGVLHSYNTQYFGLKRHVAYFELGSDDVVMCVSPVGHGTGAVNGVEFALHLGGTVVMLEAWDPCAGLAAMIAHGATMMWGATTFYTDLVLCAAENGLRPTAFRYAFTAGAPVPGQLALDVRDRLGATLVTAYGQSEGQNIAITHPDDPIEKLTGSDGRFHDGIDWKLVDADRNMLPAGVPGEIAYRGPNVCLGYLDSAHTARAFDAEGFVYSGDRACVDADGYLRIVGRVKDIIIRGGENISPAEVEELLYDHPGIAKISVVGYPDQRLGERACAVIVPRGEVAPTLADLIAHLAKRKVAKFKYPERLLVLPHLPTTASGKVRKEALRALLAEQAA